jgi:hypothetical protein
MIVESELASSVTISSARIDLLEKHEVWTLGMLTLFFAFISILFFLLQWIFSKKAEENIFKKLSRIANVDKVAFKEAVRMKGIELELLSKYPIYIISDERHQNSNSSKLYNILREFHFEIVERISYKEAEDKSIFCEKSVIIFSDPNIKVKGSEETNEKKNTESKKEEDMTRKKDRLLTEKLLMNNPNLGVMGFMVKYDEDFEFNNLFVEKGCISFAQFPSQVYNNLMSLLHYKRYLNNSL